MDCPDQISALTSTQIGGPRIQSSLQPFATRIAAISPGAISGMSVQSISGDDLETDSRSEPSQIANSLFNRLEALVLIQLGVWEQHKFGLYNALQIAATGDNGISS